MASSHRIQAASKRARNSGSRPPSPVCSPPAGSCSTASSPSCTGAVGCTVPPCTNASHSTGCRVCLLLLSGGCELPSIAVGRCANCLNHAAQALLSAGHSGSARGHGNGPPLDHASHLLRPVSTAAAASRISGTAAAVSWASTSMSTWPATCIAPLPWLVLASPSTHTETDP